MQFSGSEQLQLSLHSSVPTRGWVTDWGEQTKRAEMGTQSLQNSLLTPQFCSEGWIQGM